MSQASVDVKRRTKTETARERGVKQKGIMIEADEKGEMEENKRKRSREERKPGEQAGDVMAQSSGRDCWQCFGSTLDGTASAPQQPTVNRLHCLGCRSSGSGGYRGVMDAEGASLDVGW
ncbi:hypothetical protein QQS21_012111 [Conoideocrella luteorostrata]|uniref:Uncharacterized protein n=1 Tax=Conoideocrella luteorostrata TaxID=1105319 RepID=A0AAJ0CE56_9HYPO|nr:hypothetical protein QQS21_012111 [Conoideocrella luteorostrata]